MKSTTAKEISRQAQEVERTARQAKKDELIGRLYSHPQYVEGREHADVEVALKEIEVAAGRGVMERHIHIHREVRPPKDYHAARVLGEGVAIAAALQDLGFDVKRGDPTITHDYDGPNGVTVTVSARWS